MQMSSNIFMDRLRFLLLFLCLLFYSTPSNAQSTSFADSLEAALLHARNSHDIAPLLELADAMDKSNSSKVIEITNEALQISIQNNDAKGIVRSNYHLAKIYGETKKYSKAEIYAKKALSTLNQSNLPLTLREFDQLIGYLFYAGEADDAIAFCGKGIQLYKEKGIAGRSILYRRRGLVFFNLGSFESAKRDLLLAKSLLTDSDDPDLKAGVLNSLAHLYESLGQYDSTYHYHSLVSDLGYQYNIQEVIVGSSMNLASILLKRGLIDSALNRAKITLPLAHELEDKTLLRSNLLVVADAYNAIGRTDSAIFYIKSAIEVCKKNQYFIFMTQCMSKLGQLYLEQDNLVEALRYALEALEIAKKESIIDPSIGSNYHLINSNYLIGSIYQKMNEFDQAIYYFNQSTYEESSLQIYLESQLAIGEICLEREEYEKSKKYFTNILELVEEEELIELQLGALINLSKVAQSQGNVGKSRSWLDKAESFEAIELEKSAQYPVLLEIKAELALTSKQYSKSIELFKKSISFFDVSKRPSLAKKCYEGLSKAYLKTDQYKDAYHFKTLQLKAQESLYNHDRTKLIAQLQTQYETEKKDQQILSLERDKRLQELTLDNQAALLQEQKQNILLVLFGLLILLSVGILLFNRYRLRKKNEGLVLRTKQLVLEVQQKNIKQQLEMAELRSDFFTNVSHEFRTPLTLILGPLEKLLKKDRLEDKRDIERIHRNARQLLSLVNETLDLSKIENGHLPLATSQVTLGSYVSNVVQDFITLSEIQEVELNLIDESDQQQIDVDKNKLKKVLVNILGNAFKHSVKGGFIKVKVEAPKNGSIIISVKDNGAGIGEEHAPYIFDRFYQGNLKEKGSGVGLAISNQLVELHGGTISFESQKGEGSTFYIQLPLKNQNAIAASGAVEAELAPIALTEVKAAIHNQEGKNSILIIEDNKDVRDYIRELLERDYRLFLAADGNEGVEMAEKNSPDLIISDVMMPYKDGFELTAYLKQNLSTSHIPIILLTAKASMDNKLKGLAIGADDYLGKPFHEYELIQRCKNLIQQRIQLRVIFNSNYFVSPTKLSSNALDRKFLEKAEAIVEKQMNNPDFTIEQFCQELAYNRSGVHNKLKALSGKNTSGFIRSIRIRKAAKLLQESKISVTEIIEMTGFGSRQAFNKAFKEQFNMTPVEFRKKEGSIPLS